MPYFLLASLLQKVFAQLCAFRKSSLYCVQNIPTRIKIYLIIFLINDIHIIEKKLRKSSMFLCQHVLLNLDEFCSGAGAWEMKGFSDISLFAYIYFEFQHSLTSKLLKVWFFCSYKFFLEEVCLNVKASSQLSSTMQKFLPPFHFIVNKFQDARNL